jgi:HAD superfamily hydrolase (TIGR01490 family)
METKGYALFDLDHTLLPHDTQGLFCNFVLKRERWRTVLHLLFLPFAILLALRLISTLAAKRAFMSYLWDMPRTQLDAYAKAFAEQSVIPWAYPEMMEEIERHRAAGRVLVLNTASPDYYARQVAEAFGFDHCIATQTVTDDPVRLQPTIAANNKVEEKIPAMLKRLPDLASLTEEQRNDTCWAYSDSINDLPLLRFGGSGVVIHPSSALTRVALRQEWSFMHPKRPYAGKLGNLVAMARQFLGLYPERPR